MTIETDGLYHVKISGHVSKDLAAALVRVQQLTLVRDDLFLENARAIQAVVNSWRSERSGIIGGWVLSVPFEGRQDRILFYINNEGEALVTSHPGGVASIEPIRMTAELIDEFAAHPILMENRDNHSGNL